MMCPRDGAECERRVHAAGVELDWCPECGGVWLDKGEIEAIQDLVVESYDAGRMVPPEDYDFSFSKHMQDNFGTIQCPRCGVDMETKEYAYWSQVLVDVCPKGCGLWLDREELTALEVFFARERSLEQKEKAQAAIWKSLAEMFGG